MYYLASEDGYLGDFANGKGLLDFRKWANTLNAPTLRHFLDEAVLDKEDIRTLDAELEPLKAPNPDVKESLNALRENAKRAQEILILSTGETEYDEE
jgi:hypothetical protein